MMPNINETTKKLELKEETNLGKLVTRVMNGRIEQVRVEGTLEELRLCAEMCFSATMSHDRWKLNKSSLEISKLMTVADEALAMLILENNIEEWQKQLEQGEIGKRNKLAPGTTPNRKRSLTKYTSTKNKSNGTRSGWSLDGRKRFNEMYDAVTLARLSAFNKDRERFLKNDWLREESEASMNERVGRVRGTTRAEREAMLERMREEENFEPRCGFD